MTAPITRRTTHCRPEPDVPLSHNGSPNNVGAHTNRPSTASAMPCARWSAATITSTSTTPAAVITMAAVFGPITGSSNLRSGTDRIGNATIRYTRFTSASDQRRARASVSSMLATSPERLSPRVSSGAIALATDCWIRLRNVNNTPTTATPMTSFTAHWSEMPPKPVRSTIGRLPMNTQHNASTSEPITAPLTRHIANKFAATSTSTSAANPVATSGSDVESTDSATVLLNGTPNNPYNTNT